MTGKVKWFDEKKGFGFITCDSGHPDVFVHHSGISGPRARRKSLFEDQKVEFDVVDSDRGQKAVNVRGICQSRPATPNSERGTRNAELI